jgi:hypothetical protein
MPRIVMTIGERETIEAGVLQASPLGTLGPDGRVSVGSFILQGRAAALRRLAGALQDAADLADAAPDPLRERRDREEPRRIPLPESADVPGAVREQAEQRPAYDQAEQDELGWCLECGQECGHAGHRHAQGDHGTTICEQCGVTLDPIT